MQMQKILHWLESIFVFIVLAVYFGLLSPLNDYLNFSHEGIQESNPSALTINILLAFFLVIAVVGHWRWIFAAQREALLLWVLVALAFISVLWAGTPEVVLRRSGNIFLSTAFAVYVYHRYGLQHLVGILTRVHVLIILLSFGIMLLAAPKLGLSSSGEMPWQGALDHKNTLGAVSTIGILTASYSFAIRANLRIVSITIIFCDLFLLRMSQSVTSMAALGLSFLIVTIGSLMHSRNSVWNIIAGIAVFVGMLIAVTGYLNLNDLFAAVGRSNDLTGRSELWAAVMVAIQQRLMLGYGYGGFWLSENVAANHVWAVIHWASPNAHEGWLDLALQLGIVGVGVAVVIWLIVVWRCLRLVIIGHGNGVLYCASLLICLLVMSFSESVILRQAHYTWLLFVVAYLHLAYSAKHKSIPSVVTVRDQIGLVAV